MLTSPRVDVSSFSPPFSPSLRWRLRCTATTSVRTRTRSPRRRTPHAAAPRHQPRQHHRPRGAAEVTALAHDTGHSGIVRVVSGRAANGYSPRQVLLYMPGNQPGHGKLVRTRVATLLIESGDAYSMGPRASGRVDAGEDGLCVKHGVHETLTETSNVASVTGWGCHHAYHQQQQASQASESRPRGAERRLAQLLSMQHSPRPSVLT